MHNAVLRALGLDWCYVPLPVRPGAVDEALRGIAALGFRGANVTVPHKRAVMASLDEITPAAAVVGAVNTIVVTQDQRGVPTMRGHNTDVQGFLGSLRAGGFEPASAECAVVLGAGGAARAVVYALLTTAVGAVIVLNRSRERAEGLVSDLLAAGVAIDRVRALGLDERTLLATVPAADLLVNATTVGMWPRSDASIWPEAVPLPARLTVYDLVYNPLETRLLAQARRSGAKAIDGLGMLARQGALALELWLGEPLDTELITAQMRTGAEVWWGRDA
jgi:shikimate dehydrogenase